MKKILKHSAIAGGLLVGMLGVSGQANAHLAGATTFDFSSGVFRDGLALTASAIQMPGAIFASFGEDYVQDGIQHSSIGFGTTPGNTVSSRTEFFPGGSSHVHGGTTGGSRISQLEADAGGGFFKLLDGDAFSLGGLDIATFDSALQDGNTGTVTFRGYTSADFLTYTDVTLADDGAGNLFSLGGDFDTETGAGFNGTHLHLDEVSAFGELYLFEYWFDEFGRGNNPVSSPNGLNLSIELDNVEFGAVSAVPVPAAAYLFGSAMLGLVGLRRKQAIA